MTRPFYVSKPVWDTLSWKEQDFIILLNERRHTKAQIMRKLYITTNMGYHILRNRVREKTKSGINAVYILKK